MKISCVFNLVNGKKTSRSGKCTSPQVKGRINMYAESMFGMRLIWPLKITSYVDDCIVSFPMHVLDGEKMVTIWHYICTISSYSLTFHEHV